MFEKVVCRGSVGRKSFGAMYEYKEVWDVLWVREEGREVEGLGYEFTMRRVPLGDEPLTVQQVMTDSFGCMASNTEGVWGW